MYYNFIEIGSSDIEKCVETSTDNAVGICVEPVSKYLNNITSKNMFINIGYKQTGDIDANGNSWPNTILIYS